MATVVKLKTHKQKVVKKVGKEERRIIFLELIDRLMDYNLPSVAQSSGVAYSTIYNWCYGDTISPILRTILDVAEAIDLEFKLIDTITGAAVTERKDRMKKVA